MGHWRGPRVYDCLMLARDSGWGTNYRDPPEIENPLYRYLTAISKLRLVS